MDIECKNQITSRYGKSAQISQISEYDSNEGCKEIEVMELCLRDGNKFRRNKVDGAQKNFNPTNQGNYNKVGRPGGHVNRQNSGNTTEVMEEKISRVSTQNSKMDQNQPSGMHNFKLMI